jgi:LCP family protein required for cell wall assembly
MISIPRDSMVTLPDFTDENGFFGEVGETISDTKSKINAAYTYGGPKLLVQSVEQLSGLKVNHYMEVGFDSMKGLTDELGGIKLCYDEDVPYDSGSGMEWKAGCHNVNGKQALAFSRMRHLDPEGDLGRAKRQQQVVQQIAKKSTGLIKEGNVFNLFNIARLQKVAKAGLDNIVFDEKTSIWNIKEIAEAFQAASANKDKADQIIPIINPAGWDSVLGSIVEIDEDQVKDFFQSKI